jgi:Protein tyrosine and serine/threonine kinase
MPRPVSDMSKASQGDGSAPALVTYSRRDSSERVGETLQSASSTSNEEYDFLDFLGVAQSLKIDFLPIQSQPALDKVGKGGTANILQALVNAQTTFAFKHLKSPRLAEDKSRNLRALIAELSVLGHPAIRHHPNIAHIEGICWDVLDGGEEVWPILVFEKTQLGDLNRFVSSGPGKELNFKTRIDILFDVALAVRDLHAAGKYLNRLPFW